MSAAVSPAGAAWLNCTPSTKETPAVQQMDGSSAAGVVPGAGTGIAGVLNALQPWFFTSADNSSSGSNSSSAGAAQAEQPAAVAAARGP